MSEQPWQEGELVQFQYKSGTYIGKIRELRLSNKAVIEVAAVLRHPKQGDLHAGGRREASLFHQRKALAHREKALVPLPFIKPHDGEIPDYEVSLRTALAAEIAYCRELGDEPYAQQALIHLHDLERDYFGDHTNI